MEPNLKNIATDNKTALENDIAVGLFQKIKPFAAPGSIKTQGLELKNPKITNFSNARLFTFKFINSNEIVTIAFDAADGIIVKISDSLSKNSNFYKFTDAINDLADQYEGLNVNISRQGGDNSPVDTVMENKLYGSNKISYQDIDNSRIVIKHKNPINITNPLARCQQIESIFIENSQGERFKYPLRHLNGARALARHVESGGVPYDSIGQHIIGLSEELSALRKYKNYVGRNAALSESMTDINVRVVERIDQVKKQLGSLQKPNYYKTFVESFSGNNDITVPQKVLNDWIERLTVRTFNEELNSVFPYLYRLIDENDMPLKQLTPDDLLVSESETISTIASKKYQDPETAFTLFVEDLASDTIDVHELKNILDQEGTSEIGLANITAIELEDVIKDAEFPDFIKRLPPELDLNAAIESYIKHQYRDQKIKLDKYLNALGFNDSENPVDTEMSNEPETTDTPVKESSRIAQRHFDRMRLRRALKRARMAGAKLESVLDFGNSTKSIGEILEDFDLDPSDVGYDSVSPVDQMIEFASGFYNREDENFTKGATGVYTVVEKAYKSGKFPGATDDDLLAVKQKLEQLDPPSEPNTQSTELERIRNLAGLDSREQRLGEIIGSMSI